jgi:hypothetical protein
MIYFIGPVYTAGVRKTNVLSVYRYMHLCTNDVIHLLFEAENFTHNFCIIKYICEGPIFSLGIEALLYFVGTFSFLISLVSVLNNYLVRRKHVRPYSVMSC